MPSPTSQRGDKARRCFAPGKSSRNMELCTFRAAAALLPSRRGGFFLRSCQMGKKLYVGNLGYEVTDGDLMKMFEPHGTVESAQVIMDRDSGRSKGFGFVEMKTDHESQ